jgi:predicted PhzF superfamily epimerase YddE/YHI9
MLPDPLMQQLAMENNLAETVFFVPSKNKEADYDIRLVYTCAGN